jgi:hypothetical protein
MTRGGFGKSKDFISIHNIHYFVINPIGPRTFYIRNGTWTNGKTSIVPILTTAGWCSIWNKSTHFLFTTNTWNDNGWWTWIYYMMLHKFFSKSRHLGSCYKFFFHERFRGWNLK